MIERTDGTKRGSRDLNGGHLPLKNTEFGNPAEVSFIRGNHSDTQSPSAHCDECVVGQASLSDSFVVVPGREPGQHSPGLHPVAEVGQQYPFCLAKIAFQPFHDPPLPVARSGVKFLEHYRAEPKRSEEHTSELQSPM